MGCGRSIWRENGASVVIPGTKTMHGCFWLSSYTHGIATDDGLEGGGGGLNKGLRSAGMRCDNKERRLTVSAYGGSA